MASWVSARQESMVALFDLKPAMTLWVFLQHSFALFAESQLV